MLLFFGVPLAVLLVSALAAAVRRKNLLRPYIDVSHLRVLAAPAGPVRVTGSAGGGVFVCPGKESVVFCRVHERAGDTRSLDGPIAYEEGRLTLDDRNVSIGVDLDRCSLSTLKGHGGPQELHIPPGIPLWVRGTWDPATGQIGGRVEVANEPPATRAQSLLTVSLGCLAGAALCACAMAVIIRAA